MLTVMRQGGLAPGGLNFDCKVRRESTDVDDMFISHIGAMDTFARGLLNAAEIRKKGKLGKMVEERYSSWNSDLGKKVLDGKSSFQELEKYVLEKGDVERKSGKQEFYESVFNLAVK